MTTPRREYRSAAAPAREKRAGLAGDLELRSRDGQALVVGYAAKWGKLSLPIGGMYQERVQRGAFTKSLKLVAAGKLDLVATLNHDPNLVLGRTGNGTLKVTEDEVGLRFEATPPETTWAKDMLVQLERKDHKGCSFGFECKRDGQRWDFGAGTDGMDVRTLVEVELAEVAACTFPQYDDTTLALEYRSQAKEGSMPTPRISAGYLNGRPIFPAWDKGAEREWARANPGSTRSCFHGHLGVYLMHPATLTDMVALVRAGALVPQASHGDDEQKARLPYELTDRGVAVLRIDGTMKKEASKYGGTGTVQTQRHLKAALRNADVRAVLLVGDSPGGHVDGTKELADLVRAAGQLKPVHSYAEDMAASACYWVLCMAARFTGNATGQLGSIGAVGVITDTTGAFKREGVKVHVVATGPLKGAGTPGTPITEEHLAEVREYVMAVHGFFQAAVMAGRKMNQAQVDAVSDGRVWIAGDAVRMGLLDKVETYEEALEACAVAGEQDALGMGLPAAGSTGVVRAGGMTLADAARRQQLSEDGTAGIGQLSERMQKLAVLSPAQMTVLEILAEADDDDTPPPPPPADAEEDEDDPGLEDPMDEPADAEGDDDEPELDEDGEPVDAEGDDDDDEPADDGMEEHPQLGATADRRRRQRLARAQDERPEAEGDDDVDPTLEEEDELAEGTEDEGMEDDQEPVDAEGDDDELAEGEEDEDLEDDDQEPVEAEDDDPEAMGDDDEPAARNFAPGEPGAPEGPAEDPGPDPDTSNPGQGDEQAEGDDDDVDAEGDDDDVDAEGTDDEAGELVEDDDDVAAELEDDDLDQGVSPDQAPEARRRRRQKRAERS